jgi:3-hydroxyacyl-[acyl-carrier-protein] dehydratase
MSHPSLEKIHAAIPHRPPMLLLDEIVSQNEKAIVCQKTFHADEFFFQGHYPEQPIVPGVILCECGAQAGAVMLAGLMSDIEGKVPVLTRMNDVKFKKMVVPGDTVEISVKLDEVVSSAYFMTAQIRVAGKIAARLSLACSMASN